LPIRAPPASLPPQSEHHVLEKSKLKRPASHRWAIAISAFMTLGFVVFLFDVINGRSGSTPSQYWPQISVFSFFALAFCCLLFGGRRKWAYYVTSALLACYSLRVIYSCLWYVCYFLTDKAPLSLPYFHLAERDQTFAVQQTIPAAKQILTFVAAGFVVWLCLRFTIGRPSRNYYQFTDAGNAPSEKGTPDQSLA
jgi:hypothetical protein